MILLSAALLLARRGRVPGSPKALPILGALLSLFSLNSYALGTESVVRLGPYDNMAVTSAALALGPRLRHRHAHPVRAAPSAWSPHR